MNRPPVTDWATDFDHLDPGFVKDPHTIYRQLRDECPEAFRLRVDDAELWSPRNARGYGRAHCHEWVLELVVEPVEEAMVRESRFLACG